jgi:2-keto-3-deoxy-L-rhamnonate aldolase RhmA
LLACQIETADAMQNIDQIAAVDGVDMLFLGPSDISASIGHLGRTDHPEAVALMAEAERRMRKTGKLLGTVTRPGKTVNWTFGRGYDLVICGSDFRLLQNAANAQAEGFRTNPPARPGRAKARPRRAKAQRTRR